MYVNPQSNNNNISRVEIKHGNQSGIENRLNSKYLNLIVHGINRIQVSNIKQNINYSLESFAL